MEALTPENEASSAGEESFLLVYLCFFGPLVYFLWLRRDRTNYHNISAVGFSGTTTSFISALRWLHDPVGVVRKGYSKFSNGIFRYPTLTRWIVVVAKPKYIEELRKAPEDAVSASDAMKEILGIPTSINSELLVDQELKVFLGAQLTRKLQDFLPEIYSVVSELTAKLIISSEEDDWKYIDEFDTMTQICVQAVNHVLVGAHLSRNPEFIEQMAIISRNLNQYARTSKRFPDFLRPLYLFVFTPLPSIKCRLRTLLATALEDRRAILDTDEDTLPDDMITWLIGRDIGSKMSADDLVNEVLFANHLAIYPMVQVMTQALRNLATHPGSVKSLRREVEEATRQGGWTKASVDKMRNLDAFLKETMRLDTSSLNPYIPNLTMPRKCRRPMTFSDGTTVPQGALLFVGSRSLHTDAQYYRKPDIFEPMRFTSPQTDGDSPQISPAASFDSQSSASSWPSSSSSGILPVSLTLPATSSTFLAWGHGKHACPGRFFAASVMKLMLARFVYEFDVRPPPVHEGNNEGSNSWTRQNSETIPWIELKRCRH
ncbi:hypothetical protein D9756_006051 [Leucocoprinus leucothites]|uniref:Cytochrome P450 n=1 Tax=Leucocoprinus leucothites TaxID=201217 RepID=A0A8H5D2L4_9AGAR|nr:hypothetical protein D9756_006051 [Leucoagaricus leucothites]